MERLRIYSCLDPTGIGQVIGMTQRPPAAFGGNVPAGGGSASGGQHSTVQRSTSKQQIPIIVPINVLIFVVLDQDRDKDQDKDRDKDRAPLNLPNAPRNCSRNGCARSANVFCQAAYSARPASLSIATGARP
jgi:hypothetical protein